MAGAYSRAGPDRPIACNETDLKLHFPEDIAGGRAHVNIGESRGGIQSATMIPGGRFALVLYSDWLTLWDLKDIANPSLSLKHPAPESYTLLDPLLDGPDKLYIMLENELLYEDKDNRYGSFEIHPSVL